MKYEKRVTQNGLIQITTQDERHYYDPKNEIYMPSVTWVTGMYPKGKEFYQWLASVGWDESEAIKVEAGDKGTRVHQAIESLLAGNIVTFESRFWSRMKEREEELTVSEYEAVMSFSAWYNKVQPEVISVEEAVFYFPDEQFPNGFAGSIDLICKIDGELWVVDFKTSKSVFTSHKIQLSAYKKIVDDMYQTDANIAILQVGYARNKNRYKFTEIPDMFDQFEVAYKIWQHDVKYKDVQQKDYPLEIRLEKCDNTLKKSKPICDEEIKIEIKPKKAKLVDSIQKPKKIKFVDSVQKAKKINKSKK